jgi:hypothetical protein
MRSLSVCVYMCYLILQFKLFLLQVYACTIYFSHSKFARFIFFLDAAHVKNCSVFDNVFFSSYKSNLSAENWERKYKLFFHSSLFIFFYLAYNLSLIYFSFKLFMICDSQVCKGQIKIKDVSNFENQYFFQKIFLFLKYSLFLWYFIISFLNKLITTKT